MTSTLYGYKYSVYTRIVRATLIEKSASHSGPGLADCVDSVNYVEINPFDPNMDAAYLALHPFKRVPCFVHDGHTLYETSAITRYIDAVFPGPSLLPALPIEAARMSQIISIIDAYGFAPMMLKVFSNRIVAPLIAERVDAAAIASGLTESAQVLQVLEELMADNRYLCGAQVSLADLHLAPMMDYFLQVEEGARIVDELKSLTAWWRDMSTRDSISLTRPELSAGIR